MQSWEQLFHFFGEHGFKLIKQSIPPQPFGNFYYTFSNGQIDFQIVQDRREMILEIRFTEDKDWWFTISLVKSLIQSKMNIKAGSDIDSEVHFLMEYMNTIIEMFSEKNYQQTKLDLIERSKQSYREVYGDDFFKKYSLGN